MADSTSNVTDLRSNADLTRTQRAKYVHGLLKDERWSIRQASMRLGINNSVLASRMNGTTAFLADELEAIAVLLRIDPVDFYRDYLAVGPDGLEPPTSSV